MTTIVPQTFSQDLILPKLVAYFNALPPEQRTFKANDFPIFNVKVIRNSDGTLDLVVGNPDVVSPASNYAGEATFLWIGVRDEPAIATNSSFFEVSKYVNGGTSSGSGAIDVRLEVGTYAGVKPVGPIILPTQPGDYTYIATLSDEYGGGWTDNRLMFIIDGNSYDATIIGSTLEQVYIFTANAGIHIQALFVRSGPSAGECFLKLQQVPTAEYPDLTNAVLVFDSNGTGLPNNTFFLSFDAPYTPPPAFARVFDQTVTSQTPQMYSEFANFIRSSGDGTRIFVNQPRGDTQQGEVAARIWAYNTTGGSYGIDTPPRAAIIAPSSDDLPFGYKTFGVNYDGLTLAISGGDNLYIYKWDGVEYAITDTITAPVAGSGFGDWFVGMDNSGERVMVGAHGETVGGVSGAGAVYVFDYDGSNWNQTARLTQPTPATNSSFGAMVGQLSRTDELAIVQAERASPSDSITTLYALHPFNGGGWETVDLSPYTPFIPGYSNRVVHAVAVGDGILAIAYGSNARSRVVILLVDSTGIQVLHQHDYDQNNIVTAMDCQANTGVIVAVSTNTNTEVVTVDWFTPNFNSTTYTVRSADANLNGYADTVTFANHSAGFEIAIGSGGLNNGYGIVSVSAFEEQQ